MNTLGRTDTWHILLGVQAASDLSKSLTGRGGDVPLHSLRAILPHAPLGKLRLLHCNRNFLSNAFRRFVYRFLFRQIII